MTAGAALAAGPPAEHSRHVHAGSDGRLEDVHGGLHVSRRVGHGIHTLNVFHSKIGIIARLRFR